MIHNTLGTDNNRLCDSRAGNSLWRNTPCAL